MNKREFWHVVLLLAAVVALLMMAVEALQPAVAAQEAAALEVTLDEAVEEEPQGAVQWLWRLFISATCDETAGDAWEPGDAFDAVPPCWLAME
jgi:hypothetical protein